MLPLVNQRTLALLGITQEELTALCAASTAYVAHIINQASRVWHQPLK